MTISPEIRAYDGADTPVLLDIWRRASRVGHPFLSEADLAADLDKVRDVYLPMADTWVAVGRAVGDAVGERRPLGFIGLLDNHVGGLFVDPLCHGRGLGTALIAHAAGRLGSLTVEVYARNHAALAFYRRCGFSACVGRRDRDDGGRALDLVTLRRP